MFTEVARQLKLATLPEFNHKGKELPESAIDDPEIRDKVLKQLGSDLRIEHESKEEIVKINCTTRSAALSANIINTLINNYIERLFKMRFGATQRASNWLIGQLDDLRKQIESDQTRADTPPGHIGHRWVAGQERRRPECVGDSNDVGCL